MDRATKRLEILQSHTAAPRPQPARDAFVSAVASRWKLGEARFAAVEVRGRTEFRGADGRAIGRACDFTLADLRAALVQEYGVRRGWLRTRRPLNEVVQGRVDGEQVALRLEESATRTALHVIFLVPCDDARWQRPIGPVRFSL
jgi:hypothetical protein